MPKLVCVSGMNKEDEFGLKEGTNTIGRSVDCDIVLFDKKCSRKHCQIVKKGNYYAIEDLQSRHGTVVNGQQVTKRVSIKVGDKLRLGNTSLLLSDKSLGSIIDQTATDVAADLSGGKGYDQLIGNAAADIAKLKKPRAPDDSGIKVFFKNMFKK